jgi:hypothetical protein
MARTVKQTAGKPDPDAGETLKRIVGLTDSFCRERLNEEYAALCRKLAETLARKRPSPLLRGQIETWASGIIRVIGWANFLDDRSQSPHLKLPAIDRAFGIGESTGQGRSKAIRDLLKIRQFDHRWTLPTKWESTLMIWQLELDGYIIDIRKASITLQRAAFEKGLIPYVPAERAASHGPRPVSSSPRLLQFKITLREIQPPIWRRIQVFDDTLDKLHEHIQTAMGWTNSHLHQFIINGQYCGDPRLLQDDFNPFDGINSTKTMMSAVLSKKRGSSAFEYEYDFGDGWIHQVVFEGNPPPEAGVEYPRCLEGERACPPEDVGGVFGFKDYLDAIKNPRHEEHEEMLAWNGKFDPSAFDPQHATRRMQKGLLDWRAIA